MINIKNQQEFAMEVERRVHKNNISYIDAILQLCEEEGIEVETISKLVGPIIKGKLEVEARGLNYLAKVPQLPLE